MGLAYILIKNSKHVLNNIVCVVCVRAQDNFIIYVQKKNRGYVCFIFLCFGREVCVAHMWDSVLSVCLGLTYMNIYLKIFAIFLLFLHNIKLCEKKEHIIFFGMII